MAADSDGCKSLTTVVTCEGNLGDPGFSQHFANVVGKLNGILGGTVKIRKLEPWNSVRVTLSIPREAALRLRSLANEGSQQLRALGILSVQVEGDQVISLRIANALNADTQEILLQTTQDGTGSDLSRFLPAPPVPPAPPSAAIASTSAASDPVPFKSPNVVCPPDSVVPKVPVSVTSNSNSTTPINTSGVSNTPPSSKPFATPPFPFASMNQAMHTNRPETSYTTAPPPPYPGQTTTIKQKQSPLLVNLLQNDAASEPSSAVKFSAKTNNLVNRTGQTSSSSSPTNALSNTSTRQTNSIPNSTIGGVAKPPPPPYPLQWDVDITPTLADLKPDDLDDLLLDPDLDDLTNHHHPHQQLHALLQNKPKRKFLINPLTGEMEAHSSGESDAEDDLGDVFTGLPSPAPISDDDTSSSTVRMDCCTDQSDSETRSSTHSDSGKHRIKAKVRERGRDSPKPGEKIKLRLKLEKSEPILHSSAYKVDVSFVQQHQQQQPKKAVVVGGGSPGEELRVPPLHISLRGRHHFITKKKKFGSDASGKLKVRKDGNLGKLKRNNSEGGGGGNSAIISNEEILANALLGNGDNVGGGDAKKAKKLKEENDQLMKGMHYKERRGSDSELANMNGGIICMEKKRRMSQADGVKMMAEEDEDDDEPSVLGSTNVGTIALPQKVRKDKCKMKEGGFKAKEIARIKCGNSGVKEFSSKQVVLPTGEIDMEAKFKQRLMEGPEKGIPRPPHRTETVMTALVADVQVESADKVLKSETTASEKLTEPDKCNTPDRNKQQQQPPDLGDKQAGRSPPNSGAQGEDSGIESMDALSEKSPNQASQSPHADIPETTLTKTKQQVSDMLDIEAQLAKMEGLNGVEEEEDMNDNNQHNQQTKLGKCCELTSALQDSIKHQGTANVDNEGPPDGSLVQVKEEGLEPLPVRVKPPLYTYSNPEKGRGSESPPPTLSYEENSNSCSNPTVPPPPPLPISSTSPPVVVHKGQSLLEQLLIEIPDSHAPSSPSPATRSVRTRALSKLTSPELNSPLSVKQTRSSASVVAPPTKRKRHESDNSNNSETDSRNKKPRKCSENAAELMKALKGTDSTKVNNVKKAPSPLAAGNNVQTTMTTVNNVAQGAGINAKAEESSDSDEPLMEKVRKTANSAGKGKVKSNNAKNVAVSTRRSVRTTAVAPAPNTRSKGDKTEAEAIRRKTRSTVSDGDNKRKKEVK